jgi:hypothetical protein
MCTWGYVRYLVHKIGVSYPDDINYAVYNLRVT